MQQGIRQHPKEHPQIHNSKPLHQAEDFGVLEVLVCIALPHEVHIV